MLKTLLKIIGLDDEDKTIVDPPKRFSILVQRGDHVELLDTVFGESNRNHAITRYARALAEREGEGRIYSEPCI